MKKTVMFIAVCLMITGCSFETKQNTVETIDDLPVTQEEDTEIVTEEGNETDSSDAPVLEDIIADIIKEEPIERDPIEFTTETMENSYLDKNGEAVSQVRIDYPVIQNTSKEEGIDKINEFFREAAQALYEENDTYAADNAQELDEETASENSTADLVYSEYKVSFEVTYNKNGILSILQSFNERYYETGAENSYSTGYVFLLSTGQRLAIGDILAGTDEEIAQLIGQAFMASEQIEDRIKSYYQEEILENTQYTEVYMDDKNINFFYNPNMVIPYQEGTLKAYIPLKTENIFKIEFEAKPEDGKEE
ncbi:PdaC/SigV domain-containing protein [Konateibacter massiliensis]|uniref:PdaC/SigV domain-containing protein n=1 Tax=Konateibacter massiliensis TaxID=2002841 RepID=UPI000C15807D|nr:DUF4163 domain-containing protein [Konateibacter massiliensis]